LTNKRRSTRVPRPSVPLLCPICKIRRANTKEDIVPEWARRRIRAFGTFPRNQVPSELMPMCSDCNGTFNQNYENDAALLMGPMVSGEPRILTPSDQKLIGSWIVKTMLLLTVAQHNLPPDVVELARIGVLDMKVHKAVPHQTLVRIGSIDPYKFDIQGPRKGNLHGLGRLPDTALFSVATLGYIAWEMAIGDPRLMGPFINSLRDNPSLATVSPPQLAQVAWPSPKPLASHDFDALILAWQEHRWPPPVGVAILPGVTAQARTVIETP